MAINNNFKFYMKAQKFSPNSVEVYTRNINQFLDYVGKPENEVTPLDVMDWKESMGNYASATIAQHIASVKTYFEFLTDYEIISKNPTAKLEAPKIQNKEKHYMDAKMVSSMVRACKNSRDRAIVLLYCSAGPRVSELVSLTLGQYKSMRANREHQILIVGKGNKRGYINFNDQTCDAIDDYLKSRDDHGTGCDCLFLSGYGNQIARNNLSASLKRIAKDAGIPWWNELSNHQLRAACATIYSDAGVPVAQIRDILRHSSVTTTNRYIRGSEKNAEANVMRMSF